MLKSKITFKEFEQHVKNIRRATAAMPPVSAADKEKTVKKMLADYKLFFETLFPHYAKCECADFHIQLANYIDAHNDARAIFEAFRGAAKSVHTNIGIPLWLMFNEKMRCMMLVGNNETAACRLLAAVQAELKGNQRIIQYFGEQQSIGNWEDGEFVTRTGVAFYAIGLGQSPRGTRNAESRPDYIVVDDADTKARCKNPARVREAVEWIEDDLMGAMDIGNERFVIANNRIHKQSILATIHKKHVLEKEKQYRWKHIKVNAVDAYGNPTWAAKYTREYWHKKRGTVTLRTWEREYMNNPITEGRDFKEEWIKWGKVLSLKAYDQLEIYIDPSYTNNETSDFKAVKFWGRKGRELHKIDAFVRRCSIPTMVSYVYDLVHKVTQAGTHVNVRMEANFMQYLFMDEFDDEGDRRGWYVTVIKDDRKKGNKYDRISSMAPLYEQGKITWNEAKRNDPDFVTAKEQLLQIEEGYSGNDDSPDADEGCLHFLTKSIGTTKTEPIIGEHEPSIY